MSIETKIEELTAAVNRLTDAIAHGNSGPGATLSPAPVQAPAQTHTAPVQQTAPAQATAPAQQAPAQDDFPLSDAELQNMNAELNSYVEQGAISPDQIRGVFAHCGIQGLAGIGDNRAKYNEVLGHIRAAVAPSSAAA